MSDTWYRDPLPPYVDGLGHAWNLDGTPANQEAFDAEFRRSDLPPELEWIMFKAQVVMDLRDEYERQVEHWWDQFMHGRAHLGDGTHPRDPGLGLDHH